MRIISRGYPYGVEGWRWGSDVLLGRDRVSKTVQLFLSKVVMQMWNDDNPFVVVTVTFKGIFYVLLSNAMSEGESSQRRGGASSKSRASYYSFLPLFSNWNLLPTREDERERGMPNIHARHVETIQRNRTWTRD